MSAAKRVSSTAVNWARLAQHTPAQQADAMRSVRSRCETLVAKVNSLPAEKPAIDWAHFSKTVPAPGLVDKFRKEYEAFKVPYPRDTEGWHELIDEQQKRQSEILSKSQALLTEVHEAANSYLKTLDEKIPPRDEWTMEMLCLYFPGTLFDANNPDFNRTPNLPEYTEAPNKNRAPGTGLLSKL
uniref:ATP synthase subunit d, mitochondrial n=1 Tax=Macrostomum lignano TaxID=282301 RepID=A0A1I8H8U1_9PLAT